MTEQRLFTVAEANAALAIIRPILERLQQAALQGRDAQAEIARITADLPSANGNRLSLEAQVGRLKRDLEQAVNDARALMAEAESHGCEVKDPATGLIDFRGERDGVVVYLCWRLGEGDITFWHHLDAGFRGRQPL
jgi:hypothetical protein